MKRFIGNVTVVASLTVALLIGVVWTRGLYVRDELVTHRVGRKWIIEVFPHHLHVVSHLQPSGAGSVDLGRPQYPVEPQYWQVRYDRGPKGLVRIGIPFWLPLLFALATPLWWLIRRFQLMQRYRRGLCQRCGYDLRASRDRCPECGTALAPTAAAPARPALT